MQREQLKPNIVLREPLFAASKGLKLTVRFKLDGDGPISQQKMEETRVALRELGLDDSIASK